MDQHVKKLLGPLAYLELAEGIEGIARGIAYQVAEALGVLDRTRVGGDLRALDQDGRAALRKLVPTRRNVCVQQSATKSDISAIRRKRRSSLAS